MRSFNIKFSIEDLTVKASLHISHGDRRGAPLHFHSTYELQYVHQGEFTMEIEKVEARLPTDSLLIIAPRVFHQSLSHTEDAERLCVDIALECNKSGGNLFGYYQQILQSVESFSLLDLPLPELRELREVIAHAQNPVRSDELKWIESYVCAVFFKLSRALLRHGTEERHDSEKESSTSFDHSFAGEVISFIIEHYNRDVTVDELAAHLCFSVRQTERIIKKNMSSTFSRLLNEYRIRIARRMIVSESTMTLEEIGYAVGYRDYYCFLKQFKRYENSTPSAYRKSIHNLSNHV